ncbi:hypothetical protein BKI52_08930 [marine bacterium AO1-C]|nr:hypothetical protein BKI52_08930 [marine bacterium AO1-C]
MKRFIYLACLWLIATACANKQTENTMEQATLNNVNASQEVQKTGAIELVIFKFKAGVSEDEGIQAMKTLNDFVSKQPGFISRKFSKKEENTWVDLVFWKSMQEAETASKLVMQSPKCLEAFKVIDESSMQMMHATPVFEK